jgi:hypothetical protein
LRRRRAIERRSLLNAELAASDRATGIEHPSCRLTHRQLEPLAVPTPRRALHPPKHVLLTCSPWPIFLPVRVLIAIACSAALALVVVATAPASSLRQECDPYCPITKVSFTSVVSRNDYATLKVNVRPRARCTIKVVYTTGPSSAAGLRAKIGGLITWRWKVGSNTKLGRWPVIVDCGSSGGSARFTLRVVR